MLEQPLILAAAYVTWVLGQDEDKWIVRDQKNNKIGEFPRTWTESECMMALRLGRKYELEALNIGIAHGKELREASLLPIIKQLQEQLSILGNMNEKLSNKLEQLIIGEDAEE